ncbi:hypothetical protein THAOC_22951 [Thalassiosira oceanica]|uniref:Uncharacterized protein n=1 Tax=Thalassiosira oceanica TaxID=159749 RepID=K0RVN6_THAOC|nr:hypothetical protein THAOC_22951 [Thalassiosira oceanica]|eukprot:EJK57050.1 hypothetical protein THAOC_22951 [Thalassiosira oceanica]
MDAVGGRDSPDTDNWRGSADAAGGGRPLPRQRSRRDGQDAKSGQAPQSPQAAAKIAELQAELEALKQSHSVVVNELNAKVNTLQESLSSTLQWVRVRVEALKQSHGVAVNELNGKVDALQTKNESLTSALQWAYAVEEIPRQHWLERGHDEDYADAMENLLSSMEESIKDLRMGTVSDSEFGENMIKIEFILQDEVENYIHADQDETLMPYWKELASALRHWSEYHADGKCLKVEIIYIELPKVVLDILRPAFEESRIENVFFENSHHTGDMADFAKKVLQSNHFITEVGFGEIKFSQETVKALCGAIKSRNAGGQFIKILALRNCFDGGIDTHTLKMILTSITAIRQDAILNLNYNGMSSREAAVIARFLTSNPRLKQLEIDGNRFNDADAALLADALSSNTHLTNFSVCGNSEIKENGRLAFLRAVFDVSSLSSCASSNHTCRLRGLERDISAMNRKKKSILNKWSKIFAMLALSSEDSFINTAILRGVPAQLIPLILDKPLPGRAIEERWQVGAWGHALSSAGAPDKKVSSCPSIRSHLDTMEVDATPRTKERIRKPNSAPTVVCFVSHTMSLTSILGGTRSLTCTLGDVPQKLVDLNIFVHRSSISQSRALARGWALVTVIAEVARPGTSPGRAPPGALPRATGASAAS